MFLTMVFLLAFLISYIFFFIAALSQENKRIILQITLQKFHLKKKIYEKQTIEITITYNIPHIYSQIFQMLSAGGPESWI